MADTIDGEVGISNGYLENNVLWTLKLQTVVNVLKCKQRPGSQGLMTVEYGFGFPILLLMQSHRSLHIVRTS